MRFLPSYIIVFCALFSFARLSAQDKIYLASGLKLGRVISVSKSSIVYQELLQPAKSTTDVKKVLLMFNKRGNFLVPGKWDLSDPKTRGYIRTFLDSGIRSLPTDQVVFNNKKIIQDTVSREDDKWVYVMHLGYERKVDKHTVAAVIYRDGRYNLYNTVTKTAEILAACVPASYEFLLAAVRQDSSGVATGKTDSSTIAPAKAATGATAAADSAVGTDGALISREAFQQSADARIKQFNRYLKILCDKTATYDDQDNAIDQAVKLFIDGAKIEVSSASTDEKMPYAVHDYLENLKTLKYDKIEITWSRVEYVSNIILGADKKYHGSITFEQIFRAFKDGRVVYEDVTTKTAEVEMQAYDKNVNGKESKAWDVLLSDIEVFSTKKS